MAKITAKLFVRIRDQLKKAATPAQFHEIFTAISVFDWDKNSCKLASFYNESIEKLKITRIGPVELFDLYDLEINSSLNQLIKLIAQHKQYLAGQGFFKGPSDMFELYKEMVRELSNNTRHPKHNEHCNKFYHEVYASLLPHHLKLRYSKPAFLEQFEPDMETENLASLQ